MKRPIVQSLLSGEIIHGGHLKRLRKGLPSYDQSTQDRKTSYEYKWTAQSRSAPCRVRAPYGGNESLHNGRCRRTLTSTALTNCPNTPGALWIRVKTIWLNPSRAFRKATPRTPGSDTCFCKVSIASLAIINYNYQECTTRARRKFAIKNYILAQFWALRPACLAAGTSLEDKNRSTHLRCRKVCSCRCKCQTCEQSVGLSKHAIALKITQRTVIANTSFRIVQTTTEAKYVDDVSQRRNTDLSTSAWISLVSSEPTLQWNALLCVRAWVEFVG